MTSVITSSAPAEKRVARPQSSSAGKRCSEKAVSGTATAGSSGRPENSLRNRSYCDGSIRRKLTSTIFVFPDRKNTPAKATRSRSSAAHSTTRHPTLASHPCTKHIHAIIDQILHTESGVEGKRWSLRLIH